MAIRTEGLSKNTGRKGQGKGILSNKKLLQARAIFSTMMTSMLS